MELPMVLMNPVSPLPKASLPITNKLVGFVENEIK
jgi:hypothetical protein